MNHLTYLSAVQMAACIRRREISPVELLAAHLDRIDQLHPRLNAFVFLDRERAARQARAAEAAVLRGEELGLLHGVPVSIKSSIDVQGLPCEAGSRLRAGYRASADAPLVARLRAAGAVVLGTTNVPDMLMAYEAHNLLYGRTNNPWDAERTPGGSSGGEAAAIAAGCSPAGVGSDGGGSIRVPAHFSGICGLKPTPGRIPATGHFPTCSGPFALLGVVGPMARTVADLELLLRVMAGPDDGDPSAAPVPWRQRREDEVQRIRVGYFEEDSLGGVTRETRAAVRVAAEALKRQGLRVAPVRPLGLEQARRLWWVLFGQAGAMALRPLLESREADLAPNLQDYLQCVAAEPPLTADLLLRTLFERDALRQEVLRQMEEFPVWLCPVSTGPAFRHGQGSWNFYLETMGYSQCFNLTGNPAAVVPVGRSPEGLPIGVQIVGRPYEEEIVLAVAARVESARGPWPTPELTS